MTSLDAVRALADTVLYEGYVLYPYRATADKNQVRFQWGVLMPVDVVAADPSERASCRTTVVVDGVPAVLSLTVRLLQVQRRHVESPAGVEVERLEAGDTVHLPFDEAVPHELPLSVPLTLGPGETVRSTHRLAIGGGVSHEDVAGGRLVRTRLPLALGVDLTVTRPDSPWPVALVTVEVRNTTSSVVEPAVSRADALRRALVACHLVLSVDTAFVSALDPPEWARPLVEEGEQDGLFPVLAGPPGSRDVVLASPIILYDHPGVAPESGTSFFDSLEIDELLTLRTLTLSEEEKREVRGTDPRAAALLAEVEHLPPELWQRLHGAARVVDEPAPDPARDSVTVDGVELRRGSPVLLRPGVRRTDAHDLFLAGRRATVAAVHTDYDDRVHVAVTIDDDPGADLKDEAGRFLYFAPDEVEPLP